MRTSSIKQSFDSEAVRHLCLLLAGVALLLVPGKAVAQDAHYWTLQYGPRSSLLGGAVIGGVNDVSATFYNPGALSQATNLAFAVSTDVFEVSTLTLEDGGGRGIDLGTSRSGLRPSMVAGTIKKNLFGSGILAYSALTRVRGVHDLEGVLILSGEQIPQDIDLEDIADVVRFEGEFSDFWGGLSYSHAFGSHFGLGVTWYGAARSQRRRIETLSQAIDVDRSGSANIDIRGGRYSTIRTLFKFGAFAGAGPLTGGISLTTPSLHISGSGQLGLNVGTFAPDSTSLAINVQTDLPAEYKTPLSVGGGFALKLFGNARLHASAEWYDKVDPYFVIKGEDFLAQEPQNLPIPVDAVQAAEEVLNWAVGLEYAFSPKVNAYASFYTDNSALTDDIKRASLSSLPLNINNLNFGADFVAGPAQLTLGAGYAWGSKIDEQLTDVLRREDESFQATFVLHSIRLFFGFEVGGK